MRVWAPVRACTSAEAPSRAGVDEQAATDSPTNSENSTRQIIVFDGNTRS
jgi:hypothetical protein